MQCCLLFSFSGQAPPTIDMVGEQISGPQELATPRHSNLRTADLVINGSLVEMKLSLYGKVISCNLKYFSTSYLVGN